MNRISRTALIALPLGLLALSGCKTKGELVVDDSVGVTALRSSCPAVGIPDFTGDVTTFRVPGSTDAAAIDVAASMTNLRSQCNDSGEKVYSIATFDVLAQRRDAREARQVQIPYFVTVLRGGSAVISKRIGTAVVDFPAGQTRASTRVQAASYIDKAETLLPQDIRDKLTRKRRSGDEDAAVDPLSQPDVRAALARASFEMLVGFQMTDQQLTYNATR